MSNVNVDVVLNFVVVVDFLLLLLLLLFLLLLETGHGRGRYSKQISERLHLRWKEFSHYRLRGDIKHLQYGPALLKTVKDFNVLNLK